MAAADNDGLNDGLEAGIEDDEDSNGEGEADNEGERRRRRVPLTASASVPLFAREERREDEEELGGSETELARPGAGLDQTGLHLALSYAEPGPATTGTTGPCPPHKVRTRQNKAGRDQSSVNISGSVCQHRESPRHILST